MIVGMGVDIAEVGRLEQALARTPELAQRLFAESEIGRPMRSLAGCFAAKEAVAKALGAPPGLLWTDAVVGHDILGRPLLDTYGSPAPAAARLGTTPWHLSTSPAGGFAAAMTV